MWVRGPLPVSAAVNCSTLPRSASREFAWWQNAARGLTGCSRPSFSRFRRSQALHVRERRLHRQSVPILGFAVPHRSSRCFKIVSGVKTALRFRIQQPLKPLVGHVQCFDRGRRADAQPDGVGHFPSSDDKTMRWCHVDMQGCDRIDEILRATVRAEAARYADSSHRCVRQRSVDRWRAATGAGCWQRVKSALRPYNRLKCG